MQHFTASHLSPWISSASRELLVGLLVCVLNPNTVPACPIQIVSLRDLRNAALSIFREALSPFLVVQDSEHEQLLEVCLQIACNSSSSLPSALLSFLKLGKPATLTWPRKNFETRGAYKAILQSTLEYQRKADTGVRQGLEAARAASGTIVDLQLA